MTLRDVSVGLHHKLSGTTGSERERTPRQRQAAAANKARYQARVRELLERA
jgi:hypothetical protein